MNVLTVSDSQWAALCSERWCLDAAKIAEEGSGQMCYLKYELQEVVHDIFCSKSL